MQQENIPKQAEPDEDVTVSVNSHLVIRDKETGQVLVDKRAD